MTVATSLPAAGILPAQAWSVTWRLCYLERFPTDGLQPTGTRARPWFNPEEAMLEDILAAQCIRPLRAEWQAYKEYIPVARKFIEIFTPALVADAYFNGSITPLVNAMTTRWTIDGFRRVRQLTNQKKTQQALQAIETLEQAYRSRPRIIGFQQIFRGSR